MNDFVDSGMTGNRTAYYGFIITPFVYLFLRDLMLPIILNAMPFIGMLVHFPKGEEIKMKNEYTHLDR